MRFREKGNCLEVWCGSRWRPVAIDGAGGSGSPGEQGPQGPAGPQGPKGDTGDQGPQGIKGDTGDQGPAGAQGEQGPPGADGADGAQGAQGIQGIQGATGNTGSAGSNGLGWAARAIKTSDQTLIGTSFATVTGLSLALEAGKSYAFEFGLICDSDATTTGIDVAITGPASPTTLNYTAEHWTSATAKAFRGATGYDDNAASAGSCGTARRLYVMRGVIVNGVNAGNLSPRAKREAVGTGPNVRAGSYALLTALD
jgi:hypothetical protein